MLLKPPKPYHLRPLQLSDIEAMMVIEKVSFAAPWKAGSYRYEISENRLASYQALTIRQGDQPARLIGYGGYWIMAGEAHVSTITVDPAWRGRGLGELLLLNMLFLVYAESVDLVTLEVRCSNQVAQALYAKYKFTLVGKRPRYYRDNGEDALLMTVEPVDKKYRRFLGQMRDQLISRLIKERPQAAQ